MWRNDAPAIELRGRVYGRHWSFEDRRVRDTHTLDVAQRPERPARVVVRTRVIRRVILRIEQHVRHAAVRLIHANDVAPERKLRGFRLLGLLAAWFFFGLFRFLHLLFVADLALLLCLGLLFRR